MLLGKTHLVLGILMVIAFLLTGQFMHHNYNHLKDMELMNRALFRAGHIYILLFGLINAALGTHFKMYKNKIYKILQLIGSIAIFTASLLVFYGFFTELPTTTIERPLTRFSIYIILFGVSTHGLISLVPNKFLNK
ncbi:MAG: hypothetical protein WBF67_03340 [Olleya sp.]